VFTARYAVSPYIKQIRLVFKELIHLHLLRFPIGKEMIPFSKVSRHLGLTEDSHSEMVTGAVFPGCKRRPGRKADHLAPCDVKIKTAWSCKSTVTCDFRAWNCTLYTLPQLRCPYKIPKCFGTSRSSSVMQRFAFVFRVVSIVPFWMWHQ
jgi:hypothetical protein